MKKELNDPQDILSMLRLARQAHEERVRQLPGLSDEQLEELFAEFCREHHPLEPLKKRANPIAWTQVLPALMCLGIAVLGGVVCRQVWDDRALRTMVLALSALSLFLVLHCLRPQTSSLFRRYSIEAINDRQPPAATFGLKRVLPFCAILLLTFGLVSTLTVGDGYHITAQGNLRLASINNINSIITHLS